MDIPARSFTESFMPEHVGLSTAKQTELFWLEIHEYQTDIFPPLLDTPFHLPLPLGCPRLPPRPPDLPLTRPIKSIVSVPVCSVSK